MLDNLILRAWRHVIRKNEILEQSECMKNHANFMLHEGVWSLENWQFRWKFMKFPFKWFQSSLEIDIFGIKMKNKPLKCLKILKIMPNEWNYEIFVSDRKWWFVIDRKTQKCETTDSTRARMQNTIHMTRRQDRSRIQSTTSGHRLQYFSK